MKTAIAVAMFVVMSVSGWAQPYLGQGGNASNTLAGNATTLQGSWWPQPPGCPTEYPPKGWEGTPGRDGLNEPKGPTGPKGCEGIPGRSGDLPHGVTYPEPTIRHDPNEVTICNEIIHLDPGDGRIASVSHEDAIKFSEWERNGRQGPCPIQPSFIFRPETPEQEALSRLLAMISAALCIALVTSAVAALVVRHQRRKANKD